MQGRLGLFGLAFGLVVGVFGRVAVLTPQGVLFEVFDQGVLGNVTHLALFERGELFESAADVTGYVDVGGGFGAHGISYLLCAALDRALVFLQGVTFEVFAQGGFGYIVHGALFHGGKDPQPFVDRLGYVDVDDRLFRLRHGRGSRWFGVLCIVANQ